MTGQIGIAGLAGAAALLAPAAFAQPAPVNEIAQELVESWLAALNGMDFATFSGLYTEDAQLYFEGLPRIVGRTAIVAAWTADMNESSPVTRAAITNVLSSLDTQLVEGTYEVVSRDSGMALSGGSFVQIWIFTEAGWRLDREGWKAEGL